MKRTTPRRIAPWLLCLLFITPVALAGTVNYRYDETGRLLKADYGNMEIHYQYDNGGNLLQTTYVPVLSLLQKLQQLYVGILGRAGDQPGLDYWADQINAGVFTLENTRAAFTDSAQTEYTEIYGGLDNTQLVTAIYENFLERAPELAGLQYWVGELDTGRVNADQMINAVINAVRDPSATGEAPAKDLATLENKLLAAIYFTELTKGYVFDAAYRGIARAVVADVTDDLETLTQSKVMTDDYVGN